MNKKTQCYRIGVLGLGEGRSILSAALLSDRWEVACICDLDAELCRQRQQEFSIAEYTTSYAEMLQREDIDVIGIFTPDPMHTEHILMAFSAGKHVVCTKPLVDNLERGCELLAAQRGSGKQLLVGNSTRFFHTLQRQRRDFERGANGQLVSCEAHYNGDKRKGSAGARGKNGEVNWLYSGLGHPVDLVYWYLGEIEEVYGYGLLSQAGARLGSKVPDCFHFVLKSKAGVLGRVTGMYGTPLAHPKASPTTECMLRGNDGISTATFPRFDYFTAFDGQEPTCETHVDSSGYYFRWGGSKYHAGEFQNYLEHFAYSLDSDSPPEPSLVNGLYVVAILEAMERSLNGGIPVRVDQILKDRGLEEIIDDRMTCDELCQVTT
ncbi:Gfo/Idh/MocA family oxidoreductase [Coraliomargarita sp. SDUM461004]|uniref:Gfo/Idh/MocA family oxidoreductase n=1 Tax=Thalassobacterium sedimentorum TaxID=3041258 RepID=A0ABU1AH65_9BACT|nr:Gfo/Idh/MocA family oxidoreductase [Coraliomargarita sp. SDUM461004]MDQ8194165.1 Gfo/Idh/MocA family oxidoreductase [Coraliomargarita sp. SDUM461004]